MELAGSRLAWPEPSAGEVTGIDVSDVAIEQAATSAVQQKVANALFQLGDACNLAFPDGSFDAVFSHNVLDTWMIRSGR